MLATGSFSCEYSGTERYFNHIFIPKKLFLGSGIISNCLPGGGGGQVIFQYPWENTIGRGLKFTFPSGWNLILNPKFFCVENSTFHPHFMYCLESHSTVLSLSIHLVRSLNVLLVHHFKKMFAYFNAFIFMNLLQFQLVFYG